MEPTLQPGDTVLVDRTTQVHRGDVIVEQQPSIGPGYGIGEGSRKMLAGNDVELIVVTR